MLSRGANTSSLITSNLARRLFLFTVLILALWPMLLYPLGIAGDYPNHLARVYIEHQLAASDALQQHFKIEWGIYPDLAMDIFMRPLMAVTDPYTAGGMFNVIAAAMLPIGVALVSWTTTGRVGFPVAASVLLIYGKPLAWGFINFVFSVGLALCLFAFWIRLRPGWRRTAIFSIFMLILFFSHILGFLLFGYLMLAYEIGCFIADKRGTLLQFARNLILRDGLIAIVPLTLFAISFQERLASLDTQHGGFGGLASRWAALFAPFDFDNTRTAVFLCVGCFLVLYFAFSRRWLMFAQELRPVLFASIALVLVVPATFSGIAFLHIRFGAIPFAILLAGASLTTAGRSRAIPMILAFTTLFALQQSDVYQRMSFLDDAQSEIREAVSALPEGSRVLIGAERSMPFAFRLNHAPGLVVIEGDGYVANLFTNTSPVGVSAQAMPLHRPQAWPLSRENLLASAERNPPTVAASSGFTDDYYYGWPRTFDALFWFDVPESAPPEGAYLSRIAGNELFSLYTISPRAE